jgi:hypothetical protein
MINRILIFAALVLFAVLVGWVVRDTYLFQDAGSCTSVESAQCQPYIDLVRKQLGAQASDIVRIDGRSYCGHSRCDSFFGGEQPFDLVVIFGSGEGATFACGGMIGPGPTQGVLGVRRSCDRVGNPE